MTDAQTTPRGALGALMDRLAATRWLPTAVGGGLFVLVALWTFTATPRYRAEAMLQAERAGGGGLADAVSSIPGAALLGVTAPDEIETHVGVLHSRRLADAVIDSLALTARVLEPAGARSSVLRARILVDTAVGRRDHEGTLTFTAEGEGRWRVAAEIRPAVPVPETVRTGETFRVGDTELALAPAADSLRRVELKLVPRYVARVRFGERLEVRRLSASATLIALSFEDEDPVVANAVLSRLLAEHREFITRTARGDAGTTAAALRLQIADQQVRLRAAEEALRDYQERTGLVLPEEQGAAQVERYAALQRQVDALGVERVALARLMTLVEHKSDGGRDAQAYRQLATFPSLITNRAIQDLLLTLMTLENDRSELLLVRTTENADVRQLSGRIEELERQLRRLGAQYVESLDEQLAPTRAALATLDREIAALPAQEMQYVRLSRDRLMLNEGYLLLEKQLRQTEVQDALRLDAVRVVDAPSVPHVDAPAFPRVAVNLVLGLVLALASAGAVGFAQVARRTHA